MTLEIPSSPEDISDHEIIEVRKDSALYLEEAEGIPKLREILRSTLPKIIGSRRESSGCVSNLCTFDEDSRDSSSIDVLQDLSTFLDGRRSSSTPKLNSWVNIGTAEENLTEESANSAVDRMPTTELYRKISSAGLEMPNIEEVKEVLRDETSTRRGSLDTLCNIAKCISTEDLSTQCLLGEATTNREDSSKDDAREICDIIDAPKSSITMKLQDLSEDVFNTTSLCDSINCVTTQMASSPTFGKSLNRMIHRCSVPSSMEPDTQNDTMEIIEDPWRMERQLKMKIERDVSPILAQAPTRLGQVQITEGPIEINTEDDSLKAKANVDSNELLPRSIKVYQLLSVQSEDRVDGVPYLSDRRISLQISKQDDAALPMMPSVKPIDISNLHEPAIVSDDSSEPRDLIMCSNEDQAYTEIADSSTARSLPSPDEERTTPKFLGDTPNVTVRPIYPYCLYSPYGSPQGSPRNRRRPLRESRRVSIDNSQGALQLNQYKLLDNIGQGSYGIVKLAYNEEDDTHYAMKILSKKKLMKKAGIFGRMAPGKKGAANPLAKVYREIALLKKLDHPNVVKLVEVLDDPDEDNLYLVFELVQRGEVLQIPTDKPLAEETVRKNFRDVVLGVEYLHYQRIVHRDIKPSNLLVDSDGRIKIADLGVSAELRASGELLSGPAGTPAFAAPETTTPGAHYSGTLCDVWSMGVTLYSLVTGRVPWDGAGSIIAVQAAVRTEPLKFPDRPPLSEDLRDLIFKMLAKDPAERISLSEIKEHAWLTKRGTEPLPNEADNCRLPVTVTDEEVERVVTRIPKLDTLILIKTMLKQHSFQNPFLSKRSGKVTSNDTGVDSLEVAASGRHDETLTTRDTIRNLKSERFQRAGRSNSAPDSYDWQKNGSFRQVSVESPLPPVTEVSSQEVEVEKR